MSTNPAAINFVKKDKTVLRLQARRMYIIQSASMFVLAIYVLVLILTFSYSTFLSYQNRVTDKKITNEINDIEKLSPIEAKYILLKQKTEAANNTTKSMYRYQDLMQALFQLIPSDLLVDGFSVDEKNNVIFTARTTNPETVDNFIGKVNQYNTVQTDNKLVRALLNSVSVDHTGVYTLNVTMYVEFNKS